jgi:transposase
MIRPDVVSMSIFPTDMRTGTDTLLARILEVFGEARPHHV